MTAKKSPLNYRPEIDGIRAVAVISVILLHAGAPLPGGFIGVDVFFVLSGFLITQILARELGDDSFSLLSFYERRIRRILPALFVMVFACIPFAFWLMPPDQMRAFERSIVALIVFATNIKFYFESGYFAPSAAEIPLLHTWSLAVEEQYYLLFPVLLWGLWRLAPKLAMPVLAVLALTSLAAAEATARLAPNAAFYLLPFRAWELLAGAIAGLAVARFGLPEVGHGMWRASRRFAQPISIVGLILVLASFVLVDRTMLTPGLVALPAVAGTLLLLLYARQGTFAYGLLSTRSLVGVGLLSYSAYLWHQPLFAIARLSRIGAPPEWMMVTLTGVTFALAYFSWRFVEQPFRDRSTWPTWPMLGAVATTGVTILAIGVAGHLGFGVGSWRFTATELAAMRPLPLNPDTFASDCPEGYPSEACVRRAGPTRWAVWGDSHSEAIALAIAEIAAERGEGVAQFTRHSCPPALTFAADRPGCQEWNGAVLSELEAMEAVETVILVWRHAYYLYGEHEGAYPALPDDTSIILTGNTADEKREAYWASFATIVRRLQATGKRVVIVAPVPELGAPIPRLMVHSGRYDDTLAGADFAYYEARNAAIIPKLEAFNVPILSVARPLCGDRKYCMAIKDGAPLYYDIDHLSVLGARYLIGQQIMVLFSRTGDVT